MFQCVVISKTQRTESAKSILLLNQQPLPPKQTSKQRKTPTRFELIGNIFDSAVIWMKSHPFAPRFSVSQNNQQPTTRPLTVEEFTQKYWKCLWETEVGHLQSRDLAHTANSCHLWVHNLFFNGIHVKQQSGAHWFVAHQQWWKSTIFQTSEENPNMCIYRGCTYRVTTEWHSKSSYTDSASNTEDDQLPQKLLIAAVFILERVYFALTISVLLRENNFCAWTWKLNSVS